MHLGALEIGLIVAAAILIFGTGKIANLGKGMGQAIGNFRREMRASKDEDDKVEKSAIASSYKGITCPSCSEVLPDNAHFCKECGAKLVTG